MGKSLVSCFFDSQCRCAFQSTFRRFHTADSKSTRVPPTVVMGGGCIRSPTCGSGDVHGVAVVELSRPGRRRCATRGPAGSPRHEPSPGEVDRSAERQRVDAVAERVEIEHDAPDVESGERGRRQAADVLTGEVEGPEGHSSVSTKPSRRRPGPTPTS